VKRNVIKGCLVAAAAASLLALPACGGGDESTAAAAAETPQREITANDFSPKRFDRSSNVVDNAWFPLKPGMQLVFEGSAVEEGERVARRAIWTVTDLVKPIAGVRSVVVWERDFRFGELVEAELALFAQDRDGHVWHLGQYPEEYEEGKFVAAPTWFHGIKGAKAGIAMNAKPRVGTPDYAQGFAPPPISWVDRGQVYKQGVKTCVPAGCYSSLIIREFEPGKPDSYQLKYYARGIGNVRVGWMGKKDQDKEELKLTKINRLSSKGLANARNAAMKLERHAYKVSKGVYAKTAPMTR
jgi:hypothetical protein